MDVRRIVTGRWSENCYIVDDSAGVCVILDPGDDADTISRSIDKRELEPAIILNTHGHYDHVGAVETLKRRYDIPFGLHSADARLLEQCNFYRAMFGGAGEVEVPTIDVDLADAQGRSCGGLEVHIIKTPGHSPGSVCFRIGPCLFSGDTILLDTVGRTDLPGGDGTVLAASIRSLSRLPPATRVYPGHGTDRALGEILRSNRKLARLIA